MEIIYASDSRKYTDIVGQNVRKFVAFDQVMGEDKVTFFSETHCICYIQLLFNLSIFPEIPQVKPEPQKKTTDSC